jgi:hypothetical protein
MNRLDQTLEIKGSPAKLVGLFALGVVMTAASAAIAFGYIPVAAGSLREALAWVGVAFFGFGTVVIARRFFKASDAVVTLTPEGIRDTRLAERPIPWRAIQNIGTWSMNGQNVIVLKVPPETEDSIGLTRLARWSRGANAKLGADGLCITAAGLKMGHQALLDEIIKRAGAAQQQS